MSTKSAGASRDRTDEMDQGVKAFAEHTWLSGLIRETRISGLSPCHVNLRMGVWSPDSRQRLGEAGGCWRDGSTCKNAATKPDNPS